MDRPPALVAVQIPWPSPHEWHQGASLRISWMPLSSGTPPLVTGEAALLSHKLIDAIINSADSGKEEELQHD